MRIILAESGREFELDSPFSETKSSKDLAQLHHDIENMQEISTQDQILLTTNGLQIKDNTLEQDEDATTIVLFNRRLLQDPSLVQLPDFDLVANEMMPTFAELESMLYTLETDAEKEQEIRHVLQDIFQTIMEICQRRKTSIDKLAGETSGQAIALEAALFNLESHVKTAYQNFGKFDRIAQREFSKHTLVIDQIANDMQLLVSTSIHARILIQIRDPQGTTLDTFIPIDLMEQHQQQHAALQKQYHDLAQATMAQRNKVDYLTQQTSHVGSTNRTASELMLAQVKKFALDAAQAMRGLVACQKKLESNKQPQQQKARLRDTFKAVYRYQQVVCTAEATILQQRQLALQAFVNCMQHISKVEESVAHIYPTLAELEKQMKGLRLNIENKTNENLPKRLILGYGLLLIEIWRRDRYSDIVTKNASLLGDLFTHFGKREERYRQHFNQQLKYLSKQNQTPEQNPAVLLPFKMQDINDLPVICKTSTTVYPSDAFAAIISKHQIESYIKSIQYHDVQYQLRRKLDKETKRLNKGLSLLAQVGLPGGPDVGMNQKIATGPLSPSTSSTTTTTTTTTTDHTVDMKLASPSPTTTTGSIFQHQKDWELEKASILRQSQEYRNYIDDIRTKHENDRIKFEKDKQSLLRELYSKDKKIEEIKTQFELKIETIEHKRQEAEITFKSNMEQLQKQHNHALETEQMTHKRRLSNFYQRINDKDEAITQLEHSLRETKSAPTSPTMTSFRLTVSQEKYDQDISRLHTTIDQLKKQPSADLKSQLQARNLEIENYKSTIATLEASLKEAQAQVAQMTESEARLKQLAVAENAQMMMQAEARVENLAAEHKQSMLELQEQNENEQQVLQIKHQTEMEQIKQEMLDQQQQALQQQADALTEQEKQARTAQLADLESHWQDKTKMMQDQFEKQITLYKDQTAQVSNEFKLFKRNANANKRQYENLQKVHSSAKKMAQDLVSISSPYQQQQQQPHLDNVSLLDLLKRTLGNITSLQTKNSMMEQSMDSPYMMSSSYGYY